MQTRSSEVSVRPSAWIVTKRKNQKRKTKQKISPDFFYTIIIIIGPVIATIDYQSRSRIVEDRR